MLINDGGIFLLTEVRRTMGDIGFVCEWFHRSSETGVMNAGDKLRTNSAKESGDHSRLQYMTLSSASGFKTRCPSELRYPTGGQKLTYPESFRVD